MGLFFAHLNVSENQDLNLFLTATNLRLTSIAETAQEELYNLYYVKSI